ncbi:MAG TPA: T9SS type A sorting domain-containing protein, partial [Bacteroidia bacterium]|nr:T9SS type A sorting domain-containing protein [Bacteroidia bacterium]
DVYFDGNSFTSLGQVVYADAASPLLIPCKNFNCTGVTNSPSILLDSTVSHSMNVYGSFILSPNLTYGYGLILTIFLSGGNSNTILTSGKIIDAVFYGAGSWTLADSLTTYNFELVSGTLNLSGHTLRSLSNIITYPQSILNTGSSKIFADWILLNGFTTNVNYSNFIVSGYNGISSVSYLDNVTLTDMASAGNLNCRKITGEISASNSPYLVGGNVTCDSLVSYHNISIGYNGISGLIKTMIAYDDLHLYNGCAFDSLLLFNANDSAFIDSGAVITINDIILCNATASLPISISSTVSGLSGFILHQSGINCLNYLNIRDIQASGGAQFFAGANSVDLGGNSGWNFTSCTQAANSFYWVGGTGNWSDVSHWATTSGGTTFHTTPPDSTSDVYFDGNSSLTTNDTIYTPSSIISCRNFTSANITSAFHFGYPFSLITVHGSLNINPYLVFISAAVNMLSNNSGNTIQTNGNNSISNLVFTGGGEWSLLDSLYVVSNISISDFCTVNLNSNNITSGVDFNLSPQAILNTGSATLTAVEFYFDTGIVNGTGSRLITTTGGGASYLNGTGYDIIINNYQVIGNFTCNKIYCYYPGGEVYGNFNSNYLECHNHCYLDSSGYVGRAVIYDDADIGNLTFDTLILYNPGSSIRIMQDDTITINNALIANSVSGNTISISTLPAGSSGYINKSSGQICLQNVSLQNINTTGGAQFFAGNGCIDLGGNTGWQFAPCSIVSNVWPGDANYDLTVNNIDVLNIGLAYNQTGPVRTGASLAYTAQPATDWNSYFTTAVNKKHADTNGDGVVNDDDTTAVSLNYGLTHPARLAGQHSLTSLTDPYLYLDVTPDSTNLSDTVYIDTYYGTAQTPVDSVYGIAFTINYDTALVDTSWISNQFLTSWLGQPGVDLITFAKSIPVEGKIDFALVRNDHTNVTGFGGALTRTGIVIVDNVAGRIPVPFTLSNAYALTASEYVLGINLGNDSTMLDTTATGIQDQFTLEQFSIMPNPASEFIVLSNIRPNATAEIYNTTGQIILQQNITPPQTLLNIKSLKKGIYTLRINGNNKIFIGKLIKM